MLSTSGLSMSKRTAAHRRRGLDVASLAFAYSVSKVSEDFPEPDRPVTTISRSRGRSRLSLRLWCALRARESAALNRQWYPCAPLRTNLGLWPDLRFAQPVRVPRMSASAAGARPKAISRPRFKGLTMARDQQGILIGNLGADPETRPCLQARTVANLRIATSESWRTSRPVSSRKRTECTAWRSSAPAEVAGEYLRKGSQVYVEEACARANGRTSRATIATRPRSSVTSCRCSGRAVGGHAPGPGRRPVGAGAVGCRRGGGAGAGAGAPSESEESGAVPGAATISTTTFRSSGCPRARRAPARRYARDDSWKLSSSFSTCTRVSVRTSSGLQPDSVATATLLPAALSACPSAPTARSHDCVACSIDDEYRIVIE